MKKIRFGVLALALLMLALCAVSCSSEKVSVNCIVSVMVGDEIYLENFPYTVENKADTPPTILQAVTEVFMHVNYDYEVDEKGQSLTYVRIDGEEYVSGLSADGTYIGFWGCTVDGTEPKGRMGNIEVKNGQNIVVYFDKEYMNDGETEAE